MGNPVLEVEQTGQRDRTSTGSGRNCRGICFRRHQGGTLFVQTVLRIRV